MTPGAGRVLVVDDSSLNRQLLELMLQRDGHVVTSASDGRSALERLHADPNEIDVVLLDILMPELDGYEVLTELKQSEATHHIPVIMISSVDEAGSVVRCIEAGAADYLSKPFDAAILRARLSSCLSEKRLRDIEREYVAQAQALSTAAAALEDGHFDPTSIDEVARREDALGQLARVFQGMAKEVQAREARLTRQIEELRIEVDEARKTEQVAEITGSEYFVELRRQAAELRGTLVQAEPGA